MQALVVIAAVMAVSVESFSVGDTNKIHQATRSAMSNTALGSSTRWRSNTRVARDRSSSNYADDVWSRGRQRSSSGNSWPRDYSDAWWEGSRSRSSSSSRGSSPFNSRSYQDTFRNNRYNSYDSEAWWERPKAPFGSSSYGGYGTSSYYGGYNDSRRGRDYRMYGMGNVQGGSRKTFYGDRRGGDDGQVVLETDGRPLQSTVEVWEGPNHTPCAVRVYSEDGYRHPFQGQFANTNNPYKPPSAVHVKNDGPMEFPLEAQVNGVRGNRMGGGSSVFDRDTTYRNGRSSSVFDRDDWSGRGRGGRNSYNPYGYRGNYNPFGSSSSTSRGSSNSFHPATGNGYHTIQGGALRHFSFYDARSVQVDLKSEGMPINAKIELWQGPTCVKQVAEVYSEDGLNRPYSQLIEFDDDWYGGGTIAIRNMGSLSFPIEASIRPM